MDEEIPYNELLVDVEDGIVVGLYHYLWLKDGKGRPCPDVNVPHTIVISNGRPKVWYFTSGKEHCIKRKNRTNMNNAAVTDALAPRPKGGADSTAASAEPSASGGLLGTWGTVSPLSPPGQPVQSAGAQQQQQKRQSRRTGSPGAAAAQRVADGNSNGNLLGPWPHHGLVARFQGSMTMPQSSTSGAVGQGASLGRRKKGAQFELQEESVEFFSREQLIEMLPPGHAVVHGVAALHEGVLQRFVQPRGQHHFSIRATWSPNACVVERRTSKAKLNDPRVPLADRLAGWDGPNWLSEHTLITGSVLQGSICRLCDNVAAHLADVSGGAIRVLRMVLFFMVDDANRIWLTHCGTLKTQRLPEMVFESPPGSLGMLGPAALQMAAAAARLRPSTVPPTLPAATAAAAAAGLRLRSPLDAASGKGPSEPGLDLPAPSPIFVASKAAAAAAGDGGDGDGSCAAGTSGRFLCVLTGEMYPATQRCDVTYKQLLQHWFSLASQLPNEGDRLRAMDTIPLAIRRANPSLTREWYLRVRSQPTFLYRTAPVCAEAAGQITGIALDELQRTVRPPPHPAGSGAGAGAGGVPGLVALAGHRGSLAGAASGAEAGAGHGTTHGGHGRHRGARSAAPLPVAAAMQARQRPATAAAAATGQHQLPQASRPVSRQQPPPPSRAAMARSKSASPSMMAGRLLPSTSSGGGIGLPEPSAFSVGVQGASRFSTVPLLAGPSGLPSMLLPRDKAAAASGGHAWSHVGQGFSLLQVYGPTAEQAAEAAVVAAVLPYEALDEARQGSRTNVTVAYPSGPSGQHAPEDSGTPSGPTGGRGGSPPRADGGGRVAAASSGAASAVAAAPASGPSTAGAPSGPAAGHGPGPGSTAWVPEGPGAHPGAQDGQGVQGDRLQGGPSSGALSGGASVPRPGSRRGHMRASLCSEVAEVGSNASMSEPNSPNNGLYGHGHGHGHPQLMGVGVGLGVGGSSTRVSPPRSAGIVTLQTIHEEGAVVSAFYRPPSPLGAELIFPPPRGAGSHSVPRMRPPMRGGTDRPPALGGSAFASRRYAAGAPYSHHSASGAGNRSFSESGDLPQLPGAISLNSTMASSVGSMLSRRSTSTNMQPPGMLSNDDLRTLRELSEAYTAAEKLTQQLLAQAHEILSEDGGSRPGSTGTSPMQAGRRHVSPPGMLVPSPSNGSRSARRTDNGDSRGPTGTGGGGQATARRSSSSASANSGGGRRGSIGSAGGNGAGAGDTGGGSGASSVSERPPSVAPLPVQPRPSSGASGRGPSPLGQDQGSRQGSTRSGSADSNDDNGAQQASGQAPPPVMVRALSGSGSMRPGRGEGEEGSVAEAPADLALLTSAEADLLAEALQEE